MACDRVTHHLALGDHVAVKKAGDARGQLGQETCPRHHDVGLHGLQQFDGEQAQQQNDKQNQEAMHLQPFESELIDLTCASADAPETRLTQVHRGQKK